MRARSPAGSAAGLAQNWHVYLSSQSRDLLSSSSVSSRVRPQRRAIVAEAIAAFRKDVLIPGTWDPSKGASLRTYFIGNCKLRFANVYRRWISETRGIPIDDGTIRAELEHQRAARVPVEVTAELRRLAPRLRDGTIERINALGAVGYTKAEIAAIDGTTEGAINARLYRAREKMNQ